MNIFCNKQEKIRQEKEKLKRETREAHRQEVERRQLERRDIEERIEIRRIEKEEAEKREEERIKIIKPLDIVAMKDYMRGMANHIKKYKKRVYIVNYLQRVNGLEKYYHPYLNTNPYEHTNASKLEKLLLETVNKSDEIYVQMFFLDIKDGSNYIYSTSLLSDDIVDILYNCFKSITDLERISD